MASGWTVHTDIEEDGDCVDGAVCKPVHFEYGSNIQASKKLSPLPVSGLSNKFAYREDDKLYSFGQLDSGLDSVGSDCLDSIKSDLNIGQHCTNALDDVDIDLNHLKIDPENQPPISPNASTKRKQLDEDVCPSIDEAYYSGGLSNTNLNNLSLCKEDIEAVFCDQDNDGDAQSHLYLIHGRIDMFLQLLSYVQSAAYLNVTNLLQQSLLHLAVILNFPKVVRQLVAQGAVIDQRDRNGNTPLHLACSRGNLDSVLALTTPLEPREVKDIQYPVAYRRIPQDQRTMNYEGLTCLHLAANGGYINIVNHLITKCYADINVKEGRGGETILHQAVESNNQELVKYLLLHRELQINATRYDGSTALSLAKGRLNRHLVNILVNAGAYDLDFSLTNTLGDETDVQDESMEECDSIDSEFSYDDFKIGGNDIST